MTLKQLAAELHVSVTTLNKWMKARNASWYIVQSHDLGVAPDELSRDGEAYIRGIHLEETHPEIQQRIDNMVKVIFDQRKEITSLLNQISLLTKKE